MKPKVAIVGSGFSGIGVAMLLKRAGLDSLSILEKADRVGGTWRDNTYPGAACDVPSNLYSYSFAPKVDWSRRYAPQGEILAYLEQCVSESGLEPHLRLGTEVTGAEFDAERCRWRLAISGGEELEADVVVTGCGQLSRPAQPRLPGLDRFGGTAFHSARWDHSQDLTGRRVAVIGTGASAIQFVPAIANKVAQLHVFQRSAPFVLPKNDPLYSERQLRRWRRLPALRLPDRLLTWSIFEAMIVGFLGRSAALAPLARIHRRHLRRQVRDPALREALTPDHELGCKRVLISDDYYPTLGLPHVELVTEPIREVTQEGIVSAEGATREVDTIILGTGFASNGFVAPIEFRGRGGRLLSEAWNDGPRAYHGMSLPGFPNLFLLYGPNTNLGSGSIVYMLESQMRHVVDAVRTLSRTGGGCLELRAAAAERFERELRERLARSVWATGCASWYVDEGGRITNNWPGFMLEYRRRTARVDLDHYELRPASRQPALAEAA